MDADNTPHVPNMDEVDRKDVHQNGTSKQDVETLGGTMQASTANS